MNEQVATPDIAPVEGEERQVRRVLVLRQESVRPEFKYQVAMTVRREEGVIPGPAANFEGLQPGVLLL